MSGVTHLLSTLGAFAAIALLAGCISARPIALADGTHGWAIHCPSAAHHIGGCMNEAAMICSGRYQVFDRDGAVLMDTNADRASGTAWVDSAWLDGEEPSVTVDAPRPSVLADERHGTMIVGCQHE